MRPRTAGAHATASTAPGPAKAARRAPIRLGDEAYLWALIAIELAATAFLRAKFRHAHGG